MSKKGNGPVIVYTGEDESKEMVKDFSTLANVLAKTSLRQVANATGISYNMALKSIKLPIPNVPYDPDYVNIEELEKLILKKLSVEEYTNFDWSTCEEKVVVKTDIAKTLQLDGVFRFRNGDVGKVVFLTETHVVFTVGDSLKPQVMSFATFEHQGPRLVEEAT